MDMANVSMPVSNASNDTSPFASLELFQICAFAKNDSPEYLNYTAAMNTGFANQSLWQFIEGVQPIAMAVFYGIFFAIAFIWNLVILMIMLARRKVFKEAAHIFLANLVLTDFLVSIFIILFGFISSVPAEWLLGLDDKARCYTCDINGFFVVYLVDISIHTLAILSLDRTLHLAYPLKYRTFMTRIKALVVVVVVWVFVLLLNILPFFRVGIIEFNRRLGVCLIRWSSSTPLSFIYTGVLLVELLIPISVLLLANTITFRIISRVLRRSHKRKQDLRRMSTRRQNNIQESVTRVQVQSQEDKQYNEQQRQLLRHFTASFISSISCWMLLFIMYIVVLVAPDDLIPPYIFTIGLYMYLLTAIIHPMLETYFIPELRLFFKRIKKGVAKGLEKQTSSFADKRRKISTNNFNVTDLGRTESSIAESTFIQRPGEENPAFDKQVENPSSSALPQVPLARDDEEEAIVVNPTNGTVVQTDNVHQQRESTSNESGVFSEVPDSS